MTRTNRYISGLKRLGNGMYIYDSYDQKMVDERVVQYRDQTQRFLAGELQEEEFLNLRLRNGLYIQKHAPMLRIAVPYGMLSSVQLRKLAHITRTYDRGYGHFTTRQNLQLNWPELERVPDILEELASVEMHAIQTSGNCIRNTTSDQFAGVSPDEIADPRPWAELIRQWSTFHPEFNWLPRKFKIAITGAPRDRAAVQVHDIGIRLVEINGEIRFEILVGGGLGRTPIIGTVIKPDLEAKHLLTYLDAILRVYNRYGRRDNKYKARIKILVRAMTPEVFSEKVEEEWLAIKDSGGTVTPEEIERLSTFFTAPDYKPQPDHVTGVDDIVADSSGFSDWLQQNVAPHKQPGYAIVTVAVKETGVAPGDVTHEQLDQLADFADKYSFGEVRITHEQNVTFADVPRSALREFWEELNKVGLATPNLGLLTDIICCPGGDFCSLANAVSIPVAEAIQREFPDMEELKEIGGLDLNISGCMNACGHHHVGNIGILGVDKKGAEFYQVSVGGSGYEDASLGKILGPSFAQEDIPAVIRKLVEVYRSKRESNEKFIDTFRRIGIDPFKAAVYTS